MKFSVLLGALLVFAALPLAHAADATLGRGRSGEPAATMFRVPPRSPEAALVWASDACWRGCAQQCGWRFQACLAAAPQAACMAENDACDRACQSQCRLYGGPLLPLGN